MYMGKDLLTDQYGRYFEIPKELALLGHDVVGIALSYQAAKNLYQNSSLVTWQSGNLLPFPPAAARYLGKVRKTLVDFKPDIIWAGSDVPHCAVGVWAARSHGIPCVIDLYDNYEAYGLSKIPGMTALLRRCCQQATAVTVVGARLGRYVSQKYDQNSSKIFVLGNAIRQDLFGAFDKAEARRLLDLPEKGILFGTAGAITADRGIGILVSAFTQIARQRKNVYLVIAGQRDKTIEEFAHERIVDLGELPLDKIKFVYNALDVAVICNKPSAFGEYCFPQKFYEIVACECPVIAASVGELQDLLGNQKNLLFEAESPSGLAEALLRQIDSPVLFEQFDVPSWESRAKQLEGILSQCSS